MGFEYEMKITHIQNKTQAREIQDILFELGYRWNFPNDKKKEKSYNFENSDVYSLRKPRIYFGKTSNKEKAKSIYTANQFIAVYGSKIGKLLYEKNNKE